MDANNGVNSPTIAHAPISQGSVKSAGKKAEYLLKRYLWRSFLTIVGPLMVLGFYTFICFYFLADPLSNSIFPSSSLNANWVYFCWFLISVFVLDWARTGLANIEASALMLPHMAPSTARDLLWHMDTNWANPLWWLRALRAVCWRLVTHKKPRSRPPRHTPGGLWILLSFVLVFLFFAIPLSGLSMEVADAFTYATRQAHIYGPSASSFNSRLWVDLPRGIRRNWESGRQTSPSHGLLYAPNGTRNVSATYFDDQAIEAARSGNATVIHVFAGPAVREPIWGEAWGMSANISCSPVPLDQLQMIKSDAYNTSVKLRSTQTGCEFQWLSTEQATEMNRAVENNLDFPVWLNESRPMKITSGLQAHSLLAAADGWSTSLLEHASNAVRSPYDHVSNHDNWTFDHVMDDAPSQSVTSSMFEMLVWQAGASGSSTADDEIFKDYKNNPRGLVTVHNGSINALRDIGANDVGFFVGFGVHCDIRSAVGIATLDPDKRTFFNFTRGEADPSDLYFFFPVDIAPLQIQAMASMAGNQHWGNLNGSLSPRETPDEDRSLTDSTLAGVHRAIGSTMVPRANVAFQYYPTLSTENLTLAVYKLLGESVIGLMGEGGVQPWTSPTIHTLTPARHLRPGVVPWQVVLTLLAVWAISTAGAALYMLLFAGPRWAPTLSGFELFKFGAQYQDEIHQFEAVDIQGCNDCLTAIPGMVGMLPGSGTSGADRLGFIGLSEIEADRGTEYRYTLDRRRAAPVRQT